MTDLLEIRDGLIMTTNSGVQDLHMESDTQETINMLVEDNTDKHLIPLIIDYRKMMREFKTFKIILILREQMCCGHISKECSHVRNQFCILENP